MHSGDGANLIREMAPQSRGFFDLHASGKIKYIDELVNVSARSLPSLPNRWEGLN